MLAGTVERGLESRTASRGPVTMSVSLLTVNRALALSF